MTAQEIYIKGIEIRDHISEVDKEIKRTTIITESLQIAKKALYKTLEELDDQEIQ